MADAGQNIRKLFKDGFVIRKPVVIHSRSRARAAAEAKAKGRHSGYGTNLLMSLGSASWHSLW
jgi:large subunit ribosomal protein L19e